MNDEKLNMTQISQMGSLYFVCFLSHQTVLIFFNHEMFHIAVLALRWFYSFIGFIFSFFVLYFFLKRFGTM
jgi:hypothetical protein